LFSKCFVLIWIQILIPAWRKNPPIERFGRAFPQNLRFAVISGFQIKMFFAGKIKADWNKASFGSVYFTSGLVSVAPAIIFQSLVDFQKHHFLPIKAILFRFHFHPQKKHFTKTNVSPPKKFNCFRSVNWKIIRYIFEETPRKLSKNIEGRCDLAFIEFNFSGFHFTTFSLSTNSLGA